MHYQAIKLSEELSKIKDNWSPQLIGEMNDYQFKIVKIAGDYEWHVHPETDKLFFVIEGKMIIDFRDGQVRISKDEMFIVPRGLEIKPSAEKECHIMLMEPKSEGNTGGTESA
ncbi:MULTISPECIES: cupin domain-containing protein [unclassified Paenibacillus]|uniref:cupin domain-containing protein n=1 Tax=unclassified Paenibacillus TaxID=185978 RepID=UPI0007BF6744|nr:MULTISPECIES: cupin domain-containing protein [unclassified Paenibacillus]SHN61108.1 Cupin domain-containing protein [Paenibacillus sp. ov031]